MDDLLMDRDALGRVVDELIKQRALTASSAEELNNIRNKAIETLDDHIGTTVLGSLDRTHFDELNQLLDNEETSPDAFENLFKRAGIDVEQKISEAVNEFSTAFLKGANQNV